MPNRCDGCGQEPADPSQCFTTTSGGLCMLERTIERLGRTQILSNAYRVHEPPCGLGLIAMTLSPTPGHLASRVLFKEGK
jgi:hypothetical protein